MARSRPSTSWGGMCETSWPIGPAVPRRPQGNRPLRRRGWSHAGSRNGARRFPGAVGAGRTRALGSDSSYPDRLRKRLRHRAPPVLFGCGNGSLVGTRGLRMTTSVSPSPSGELRPSRGIPSFPGPRGAWTSTRCSLGTVIGVVGDCSDRRRRRSIANTLPGATWCLSRPFSQRRPSAPGRRWSGTSTSIVWRRPRRGGCV